MPFKIVRNDITKVKADAIVNTANPNPICGSGTDLAIYEAAGKEQLLAERSKIGKIVRGEIIVTGAYNLNANGFCNGCTLGKELDDIENEMRILSEASKVLKEAADYDNTWR